MLGGLGLAPPLNPALNCLTMVRLNLQSALEPSDKPDWLTCHYGPRSLVDQLRSAGSLSMSMLSAGPPDAQLN